MDNNKTMNDTITPPCDDDKTLQDLHSTFKLLGVFLLFFAISYSIGTCPLFCCRRRNKCFSNYRKLIDNALSRTERYLILFHSFLVVPLSAMLISFLYFFKIERIMEGSFPQQIFGLCCLMCLFFDYMFSTSFLYAAYFLSGFLSTFRYSIILQFLGSLSALLCFWLQENYSDVTLLFGIALLLISSSTIIILGLIETMKKKKLNINYSNMQTSIPTSQDGLFVQNFSEDNAIIHQTDDEIHLK